VTRAAVIGASTTRDARRLHSSPSPWAGLLRRCTSQAPGQERPAAGDPLRSGFDFSKVPVHAQSSDGVPIVASLEEAEGGEIAIDQPAVPARPPVTPSPRGGGAGRAPTCPTNIEVAEILPVALRASNVAEGFRTGVGGIAKMEVSDPSGRDWAGTAIHETITPETNSCQPGTSACPNRQGQGGAAGSTFTVGDPASALGLSLPSERNRFYDFHIFGQRTSVLHQQGLTSCQHRCAQRFDCGGRAFGPVFVIHRRMSRDRITVGGSPVDITRVQLNKPERYGPGDFPIRTRPPAVEHA
jgi:hypothetical protein